MKNRPSILTFLLGVSFLMVSFLHAHADPLVPGLPPGSSITNITICNNQLPYNWNNITCLTAGSYSATLTGSTGDSIAVLNLTVLNVSTSITNANVCNNELPYLWNGNSYSTNGTYSVTLTNSSGCDSVPILSLIVNDVVTSTTNRTICSNQLPFNWNGNNYPAAGTYLVTLTSAAGCDSLATLNLTVNPVSSSNTTAVICNSQLPYNWNGNTYPAAGSYSINLLNSYGCDSLASLSLSTVPNQSSTTAVTICNNQLPYSWNSNNYAAAGTYSVTLVSSSGCDSIATLQLTVRAVVTSSSFVTICTGQLPYSWNGNNYASAGTYLFTLTGSSGCDSIARLFLTTVSFYNSTTNQTICNSDLPYTWNGNSYAAAGSYPVSFTTSAGCDSIATLNLTVLTPQIGTDSVSICESALPFNYHGNIFSAGGTYPLIPPVVIDPCHSVDTLVLEILLVVPGTTTATVCTNHLPFTWNGNNYSSTGIYGVQLTSSSGCDSLANLNLTVNPFSTSISNITICSNQVPFNWNGSNYAATGQYVASLTSTNGCDSLATLNLTVNAQTASTTDITACISQLPFNWNGNNYSTNGTYTVTLTNSAGCDSVATLNFVVLPFLNSSTAVSLCSSQLPFSWNGNSYSIAGVYSVTLTSSAGCDSVATLDLVINDVFTSTTDVNTCTNLLPYTWNGNSYNASGTYIATLTTSGGCDSIATLNLVVNPTAASTTVITICNNQLPFSWNGNSFAVEGTYQVTLTGSSGCDSVATLDLIVTDILTSTTNVNVCPALLPYQWNGNSYTTGGTYSVTLSNSAGCDSVPILSLTVVPYVTSTTDLVICNSQLPYSWNGNSYTAAGTYDVLLTGITVCDSLATLNLTVLPAITSNTAISVCDNQLPFTWNGNSYSTPGIYQATLISSGGCDSIATLNFVVNATVTSTSVISICDVQLPFSWNGNSYPLAGTYTITLTSSAGCDSIATLELQVNSFTTSLTEITTCITQLPYNWNGNNYPSAGTYTVTLTGSAGCDSIATLNLYANPVLTSTTIISTCDNQLPYNWNGNNYSATGNYSITLPASGGCDSIATLELTINPVFSNNIAASICENQLPYNWNGNDYATPGNYQATLMSSGGCDSIVTLNLIVNTTVTSNTDISICDVQLPFNWNGNNYPAAGTYAVTLTSSSGCDSIATLELQVNSFTTSLTEITTCITQLPYSWNGNNYPAAGTYSVTLTGSAGCDSIATLQLFVNPTLTSTTIFSTCDNQLPYNWNGNNYSTSGTYSITLPASGGCDSIATLALTINPVLSSNSSASVCNNQLPYNWNGQLYNSPGLHTLTLVSSLGCDSLATLDLTINNVTGSTTLVSTCTNQLPFSWNGQQYSINGTYSVTLNNAEGCDSVATLQLTINPETSSTTNTSICSSQLPYSWNGQNYSTAGPHFVVLTGATGCDSVATLQLTINPTPPLPIVQSPVVYCQYQTAAALEATLTSSGGQLLWYTVPSGGTGSLTAPVPSTLLAGNSSYYVSQVDGPCEGQRVLITVTVNSKPDLGPDKIIKICFGDSANLQNVFNTAGTISNWTHNQAPVSTDTLISIAGDYQLIVQNSNGCLDTAIANIIIHPMLTANAGNDGDAEYNVPYQLSGSGGGNYQWSPSGLLNNPYLANPLAVLTANTTFVLMVSDDIGCIVFDTVQIRVLKGPTFYVPSAFTPNGDGLNDIFKATPVGIKSLEFFRVFNRFGELVFETRDIGKGWDGIYKGIKQPLGNYVWSLKGVDRLGETKILKGNVVLIR